MGSSGRFEFNPEIAASNIASMPRHPASFRDPDGYVVVVDERIIRVVAGKAISTIRDVLGSRFFADFVHSGRHVVTTELSPAAAAAMRPTIGLTESETITSVALLEHERIWFENYPYEWAPEMLHAAAKLTLELAEESLKEGFGLKDATPYNIFFRGHRPVFIDVLSLEKRDGDSIWMPYGQFVRTFLLPLFANRHLRIPLDSLLMTRRDGLSPEEVHSWCGVVRRLLPPALSLVTIPAWFSGRAANVARNKPAESGNSEKNAFILRSLYRGLASKADKLVSRHLAKSAWSEYERCPHLSDEYVARKRQLVEAWLQASRPAKLLDIGCNKGDFTVIAAKAGADVIAIDHDPAVIGALWRRACELDLSITPLVVNLARPTPSLGWNNGESKSFIDRASGAFDAVMMLAIIHHLVIAERVPAAEVIRLAAELTRELLIFEYVSSSDLMVKQMSRGRERYLAHYSRDEVESMLWRYFNIAEVECLKQDCRWLYLLRKKSK